MRSLENLDPSKYAVVIIDLQTGYCDPQSDCAVTLGWDVTQAQEVAQRHVDFLQQIRQLLPPEKIIWVRMEEAPHSYASNTYYGPKDTESVFAPLCVQGTPGHDYYLVGPLSDEPEFLKFHNSAFSNPDFKNYLDKKGITQLVFTGVVASRCVNATIVTASALGFECIVLNDLVGGPRHLSDEIKHHMLTMTFFYAMSLSQQEFINKISSL